MKLQLCCMREAMTHLQSNVGTICTILGLVLMKNFVFGTW